MTSTYPSVVASMTRPLPTDHLNSPSHSSVHGAAIDEIVQLETFIGDATSVAGTLLYDIRSPNSNGGGHVQSANKGGTGQTSYSKGDMLVATSTSVLSKLAAGIDGQFLKANSSVAAGVQWAALPGTPIISSYVSASTLTWVKPSVFSYIIVEVLGAGAGGTVSATSNSPGGGSGGYARKVLSASILNATETVVIGAGGAKSSVGGTTYFGTTSYLVGFGGGSIAGNTQIGGLASGDFAVAGFGGGVNAGGGGVGADSPMGFGKGGGSQSVFSAGLNGQGYGAGGAGGSSAGGAAGVGTGTGGLVIITQF